MANNLCLAEMDFDCLIICEVFVKVSEKKTLKTLWPFFIMDGVQLPQGYSHFEEAVYFLPLYTRFIHYCIITEMRI